MIASRRVTPAVFFCIAKPLQSGAARKIGEMLPVFPGCQGMYTNMEKRYVRMTNVCEQQSLSAALHIFDTISIARIFKKIVSFFSHVSVTPYSSSVNFRSAASFRLYTCAFSKFISSQSRSTCPFCLFT